MSFIKGIISRIFSRDFYNRQFKKIKSSFIRLDVTPNPTLIMTLLVKNEEDIIEENLIFHKAMGVDGFIVTDNNSTDNTVLILKKYLDKGWIKEIIYEKGNNHKQENWVDRMILLACNKYKADWIINADADEFWFNSTLNLKTEISNTRNNILVCPLKCVIPIDDVPFWKWKYVVEHPINYPKHFGLSQFSIYNKQIPKVMHRTEGYKQIYPGNHWVNMKYEKVSKKNGITIYHYTVRSFNHFMKKIINGGEALNRNPDIKVGVHWRYLYDVYQKKLLPQEYNNIIGRKQFDLFLSKCIIKEDSTVYNILSKLLK